MLEFNIYTMENTKMTVTEILKLYTCIHLVFTTCLATRNHNLIIPINRVSSCTVHLYVVKNILLTYHNSFGKPKDWKLLSHTVITEKFVSLNSPPNIH